MTQERKPVHGEPGILRKKQDTDEELLVFGYSCKLFRDDEKAQYIDQGKHLIPWMGDESLKIDRYDARGALSDLSQFESKSGIHGSDWYTLSTEERRIEQLCDQERYRALYHNEEEEALYQEEELKRLHKALGTDNEYGQVEYKYGDDQEKQEIKKEKEKEEEDTAIDEQDEPFDPPPNLDIPPNMVIPQTKKLNAIIEKTAMFINRQGLQMEILLKTKQASNPQFDFLSHTSQLYPYYRHLLLVIKNGRYRPVSLPDEGSLQDEQKGYDDYYLHPSLAPVPTVLEAAPSIPSINYKPSSDCLYSMLVNKIKGKIDEKSNTVTSAKESVSDKDSVESPLSQEETTKPVEIYCGPVRYTYSNNGTSQASSGEEFSSRSSPVQLLSKAAKRRRRKRLHNEAVNGDGSSVDTEISSTECGRTVDDSNNEYLDNTISSQNNNNNNNNNCYSSGESCDPIDEPPSELKVIIDKMAVYVAKNGTSFESIVRSKGSEDPRFAFLDITNKYYAYYKQQVRYYEKAQKPPPPPPPPAPVVVIQSEEVLPGSTQYGSDMEISSMSDTYSITDNDKNHHSSEGPTVSSSLTTDSPLSSDKSLSSPNETASSQQSSVSIQLSSVQLSSPQSSSSHSVSSHTISHTSPRTATSRSAPSSHKPVPVCFSIKKPKETEKLELCSALPMEESSDDEEGEEDAKSHDSTDKTDIVKKPEEKKIKEVLVKKWEDRVKDKLALAAKEKVSMKEREKQLQTERKRRAAAFLNQLTKDTTASASTGGSQSDEFSFDPCSLTTNVPSCVTSPGSGFSTDKEDRISHTRINTPRLPSPIQISDEDDKVPLDSVNSAETLARILEAIPKEKRRYISKQAHRSQSTSHRSRSHSHSKHDIDHKHHKHHHHRRHHHNDRERSESHHKISHKRKRKHKSCGKMYKHKKRNNSSSSD